MRKQEYNFEQKNLKNLERDTFLGQENFNIDKLGGI